MWKSAFQMKGCKYHLKNYGTPKNEAPQELPVREFEEIHLRGHHERSSRCRPVAPDIERYLIWTFVEIAHLTTNRIENDSVSVPPLCLWNTHNYSSSIIRWYAKNTRSYDWHSAYNLKKHINKYKTIPSIKGRHKKNTTNKGHKILWHNRRHSPSHPPVTHNNLPFRWEWPRLQNWNHHIIRHLPGLSSIMKWCSVTQILACPHCNCCLDDSIKSFKDVKAPLGHRLVSLERYILPAAVETLPAHAANLPLRCGSCLATWIPTWHWG